jgi:multidrug efflux pump subunit AcrA (membrane-fusion protein)
VAACGCGILVGTGLTGHKEARGQAKPASAEGGDRKTVKVEKGPLKAQVELKGIFEAEKTTELSVRPEEWSQPLVVVKALPHGQTVKQGDVLVQFETEKIDRAIDDLKMDVGLSELGLELAQQELPILEKFLPLDLAAAERDKQVAEEDLKNFLEVDRPLSEQSAVFMARSSEEYLKYAREELRQLEAMYRDKDLTEDTEEMILQRQRFQVESAEFQLKQSKNQSKQTLEVKLPRQEQLMREAAVKQTLAFERARSSLPLALNQKRLAFRKQKADLAKSAERLKDLLADREALTVKAPADGVVYYGKAADGEWSGVSSASQKLVPGGNVMPVEVFMTVVQPRPMFVRATVEEKDLHELESGVKGLVKPAGYPDVRLAARLVAINPAPRSSGQFEARVEVEIGDDAPPLAPGMTGSVNLARTIKDEALTLPESAVFTEDGGLTRFVYRPKTGGEPEKRTVKAGRTVDGRTEILEGLSEGDEVLASKP